MPTVDENILNGVETDEDALVEDMLRQDVSQRQAAPTPKMEVLSAPKPETLLVHIPAGNPNGITVTPVEKTADGKFITKAASRPPTKAEMISIRAKHEVISGPGDDAPVANPEQQKRPWWHWALGGVVATGAVVGAVVVVRHYTGAGQEVEFEEEEDAE